MVCSRTLQNAQVLLQIVNGSIKQTRVHRAHTCGSKAFALPTQQHQHSTNYKEQTVDLPLSYPWRQVSEQQTRSAPCHHHRSTTAPPKFGIYISYIICHNLYKCQLMIELYHLNMILPLILSVIQLLLTTCLNCDNMCDKVYVSRLFARMMISFLFNGRHKIF